MKGADMSKKKREGIVAKRSTGPRNLVSLYYVEDKAVYRPRET